MTVLVDVACECPECSCDQLVAVPWDVARDGPADGHELLCLRCEHHELGGEG